MFTVWDLQNDEYKWRSEIYRYNHSRNHRSWIMCLLLIRPQGKCMRFKCPSLHALPTMNTATTQADTKDHTGIAQLQPPSNNTMRGHWKFRKKDPSRMGRGHLLKAGGILPSRKRNRSDIFYTASWPHPSATSCDEANRGDTNINYMGKSPKVSLYKPWMPGNCDITKGAQQHPPPHYTTQAFPGDLKAVLDSAFKIPVTAHNFTQYLYSFRPPISNRDSHHCKIIRHF